jgi:hypothetical protein
MSSTSAVPALPIVVADSAAAIERVRGTLAVIPFGQVVANTLPEAKAAVTPETPLVICGCHFDDGRMYELLRHLKACPALAGIPFLSVRVLAGELDDAMYESVKIATRVLGGNGFIDLFRWRQLYGEAEADRQFAERVAELARG